MEDIRNCPKCNAIFVKNQFRDVCQNCWKEEERAYETIYQFMRKRENRAATIAQVVNATDVDEELILKFIKSGRLKLTQFPNLGYPCDRCGAIIREGKLCGKCNAELRSDLEVHTAEEERRKEIAQREKQTTYLAAGQKPQIR